MLIVPAYAKLNLALEVVARRDDRWHDLESVLVRIDWHDLVAVSLERGARAPRLRLSGSAAAGVPPGDANLAARAAAALQQAADIGVTLAVWLEKRVPHGAGLGGGSADAAAVLGAGAALLRRQGVALRAQELHDMALRLGSDVPAMLGRNAWLVQGRGERLRPLPLTAMHVVVAATSPSSTAATFAALRPEELRHEGRVDRLASALREGQRIDESLLGSALEAAACRASPELRQRIAAARAVVPEVRWSMTGSGGAVFTLVRSRSDAAALAKRMRSAGFAAQACRTLASEPTTGNAAG